MAVAALLASHTGGVLSSCAKRLKSNGQSSAQCVAPWPAPAEERIISAERATADMGMLHAPCQAATTAVRTFPNLAQYFDCAGKGERRVLEAVRREGRAKTGVL